MIEGEVPETVWTDWVSQVQAQSNLFNITFYIYKFYLNLPLPLLIKYYQVGRYLLSPL